MTVNNPPDVRQADARALEFVGAMKTLEDAEELGGVRHVEADTVVAHADHHLTVLLPGDAHLDPRMRALPRVLHRIGDEIRENEPKHLAIAADPRQRSALP